MVFSQGVCSSCHFGFVIALALLVCSYVVAFVGLLLVCCRVSDSACMPNFCVVLLSTCYVFYYSGSSCLFASLVMAVGFSLLLHSWFQLLPVAFVFGPCSFRLLLIQVEIGGGCMLASSEAHGS